MDGRGDQQRNRLAGCAALSNKHRKRQALEKDAVVESQVFIDNQNGYHQLQFVKGFLAHTAHAVSMAENLRILRCLSMLCKLQVGGLRNRAVCGCYYVF